MLYKEKYPIIMKARSETLARFGIIDDGLTSAERANELTKMRAVASSYDVRSELVKAISSRFKAGHYHESHEDYDVNKALVDACKYNVLELLLYLLTTPLLRKKIDLNYNDNQGFIEACKNNSNEVVKYLILGESLTKTKKIEDYLKEVGNEFAENIFKIRDLSSDEDSISTVVKI